MRPLIDKARLLQELVNNYDTEGGQKISAAKLYNLVLAQKDEEPLTGYWYPALDGDGWRCSNCGEDFSYLIFDGPHERFCRNCGAFMSNYDTFNVQRRPESQYEAWRIE